MTSHFRQEIPGARLLSGFAGARERAVRALGEVRAEVARGGLHVIRIAREAHDVAAAQALAERLRNEAEHVVVLGIGGSSLGAQALAQLKGFGTPAWALRPGKPHMHFPENPDATTFAALIEALPAASTRYVIVSKSGTTAEPLMQGLAAIAHLEAKGQGAKIGALFSVVTEPRDNPLARLAAAHGMARLDHPTDIGGRFSVLSIVGLLPALVMGLDVRAIRAGAAAVWDACEQGEGTPVDGAAFSVAGAEAGRPVHVMMPYADRLERFAFWYRQLWAESLGKAGKGTLPVRALGPTDQHSQLQLYLDGPDSALMTLMIEAQAGKGPQVAPNLADPALSYLAGRRIGDLVAAEARATYATLQSHGRACRLIDIPKLDEASLGALLMHFMIETMLSARMIGVDAFDQPAVEEGKVLARRTLQEMR